MKYDTLNFKDLPKDLISEGNPRIKIYGSQNHSRRRFRDPNGKLFYKIWDNDYVRRNNLPDALDAEFYDEKLIPAFRALIHGENDVCMGYIMAVMEKGSIPPDKDFLQHIMKKTRQSKYFFYDFWRASIMEYEGKLCLIDLESVYPVCEYEFRKKQNIEKYNQNGHLIKNPDYRKFMEKLYTDIC